MTQVEPAANAVRVLVVGGDGTASSGATAANQTTLIGHVDGLEAGLVRTVLFAKVDTAASGNTAVVAAAGSGNKIRVLSYALVASAAVSAKWRSANTDLSGAMALAANGGVSASSAGYGLLETAANEALNINLSGAQQVSGHISYYVTT